MDLINDILQDIWKNLILPLVYFNDPGERINYIYLLSSALLAYYVYNKAKINIPFYQYIFHPKIWWSRSAFIDYKLFFFNGVIKIILILPLFQSWRFIGVYVNDFLEERLDLSSLILSKNQTLIIYSIAIIVVYDFIFYLIHLAFHKIPFLWEFHKIHHSATTLNPITQYRLHPVELFINNVSFMLVSSILMGVMDYFYQGSIQQLVYAEVNIFALLFLFWGANLRHSHVKLGYFNTLEKFIMSPFQHQIHHSDDPAHFDKNFGAKLSLWDRLFGTLARSNEIKHLRFGLGAKESEKYTHFMRTLTLPFTAIFQSLRPNKQHKYRDRSSELNN